MFQATQRMPARRRAIAVDALTQHIHDARSFIDNLEDHRINQAREDVDRRLEIWGETNRPMGRAVLDPLDGLYDAVRECRFASRVHAMDRRRGRYESLNAYEAVESGIRKALTAWLSDLVRGLDAEFKALVATPEFADVRDHIRLRRDAFNEAHRQCVKDGGSEVRRQVEGLLWPDKDVWESCTAEWGGGPGFKGRVLEHLTGWRRRHYDALTAHEASGRYASKLLDGSTLGGAEHQIE